MGKGSGNSDPSVARARQCVTPSPRNIEEPFIYPLEWTRRIGLRSCRRVQPIVGIFVICNCVCDVFSCRPIASGLDHPISDRIAHKLA